MDKHCRHCRSRYLREKRHIVKWRAHGNKCPHGTAHSIHPQNLSSFPQWNWTSHWIQKSCWPIQSPCALRCNAFWLHISSVKMTMWWWYSQMDVHPPAPLRVDTYSGPSCMLSSCVTVCLSVAFQGVVPNDILQKRKGKNIFSGHFQGKKYFLALMPSSSSSPQKYIFAFIFWFLFYKMPVANPFLTAWNKNAQNGIAACLLDNWVEERAVGETDGPKAVLGSCDSRQINTKNVCPSLREVYFPNTSPWFRSAWSIRMETMIPRMRLWAPRVNPIRFRKEEPATNRDHRSVRIVPENWFTGVRLHFRARDVPKLSSNYGNVPCRYNASIIYYWFVSQLIVKRRRSLRMNRLPRTGIPHIEKILTRKWKIRTIFSRTRWALFFFVLRISYSSHL